MPDIEYHVMLIVPIRRIGIERVKDKRGNFSLAEMLSYVPPPSLSLNQANTW